VGLYWPASHLQQRRSLKGGIPALFDDKTDDNVLERRQPETYTSPGWETNTTADKLNGGTRGFLVWRGDLKTFMGHVATGVATPINKDEQTQPLMDGDSGK
jgi:hypothetical protein